jgi:hypothetical protein
MSNYTTTTVLRTITSPLHVAMSRRSGPIESSDCPDTLLFISFHDSQLTQSRNPAQTTKTHQQLHAWTRNLPWVLSCRPPNQMSHPHGSAYHTPREPSCCGTPVAEYCWRKLQG